jgi:hypothetical protein
VLAFLINPVLFGLAGIAYLLPGATVSDCANDRHFTGAQLITYSVPRSTGSLPDYECTNSFGSWLHVGGPLLGTIVLIAVITGFLLSTIGWRRAPGWCAALGLATLISAGGQFVNAFGPTINLHSGADTELLALASATLWGMRGLPRRLSQRRAK